MTDDPNMPESAMKVIRHHVAEIDRLRTYVRHLEDAVLMLWAELPAAETVSLSDDFPALEKFVQHLHEHIEHEQAMVRENVWGAS